jgi:hypothetical protein
MSDDNTAAKMNLEKDIRLQGLRKAALGAYEREAAFRDALQEIASSESRVVDIARKALEAG